MNDCANPQLCDELTRWYPGKKSSLEKSRDFINREWAEASNLVQSIGLVKDRGASPTTSGALQTGKEQAVGTPKSRQGRCGHKSLASRVEGALGFARLESKSEILA